MILTLFTILVTISLIVMIFGFISKIPIFSIGGAAMFMILGGVILGGEGLAYKTGSTEMYNYGNNFSSYHWEYDTGTPPDSPELDAYLFHKNITNQYENYDDTTTNNFGWILFVLGLAALAYSLYTIGD